MDCTPGWPPQRPTGGAADGTDCQYLITAARSNEHSNRYTAESQIRPGAVPEDGDYFVRSWVRSFEHSNRYCGISPEMPLEPFPRTAIAVQKWRFPLVSGQLARNPHLRPCGCTVWHRPYTVSEGRQR